MRATGPFQPQLPEASEMDIVVGILWARIGTLLGPDIVRPDGSRYESGTVYELETAAESFRKHGVPDLLVYRKKSNPPLELDDEVKRRQQREQLEALEEFIRRWFFNEDGSFKAAFQTFKTTDLFEQQLETHLRKLIREKVERSEQSGEPADGEFVFHGVPYPGLKAFSLEDAPVFYGRDRAMAAVKDALRAQAARNCAFLLIFGMSGSGKSSLVRAGLLHALKETPNWIPEVDIWRWCVVRLAMRPVTRWRLWPRRSSATRLYPNSGPATSTPGAGSDIAREPRLRGRDSPACASCRRPRGAGTPHGRPTARRAAFGGRRPDGRTLHPRLARRAGKSALCGRLGALARSGAAWVVGTMRSDFFGRCAGFSELAALKEGRGHFDLAPPLFAEIGQMIRYPARRRHAVGEGPGAPRPYTRRLASGSGLRDPKRFPLLQFTLNELFRRRAGHVLTWEDYRALGGLEGCPGQPCRGDVRCATVGRSGRPAGPIASACYFR